MASGVFWTANPLPKNIATLHPKIEGGLAVITSRVAGESQDFMRLNAKWNDQTGNARNGLFAKAESKPGMHRVICYHTMPYGIWLEVRWSGALGIIPETILTNGMKAMQYVNGLFSHLGAV